MTARPRPGRVRAVLFDLDGTLADTEPLHHASTNRVLAPFRRSLSWEEYVPYIGVGEIEYWVRLKARFALPLPAEDLAARRTRALIEALEQDRVLVLPGVAEILDLLGRHRVPAAVASSSPRLQILATLRAAGIIDRFRAVVSGHDDVPRTKPAPDVYLAAAAGLGVPPEDCVAVEDSAPGVAAAAAAGCFVVAVPFARGQAALVSGADLVLSSMTDLGARLDGWLR